jgi:hypothetical protein
MVHLLQHLERFFSGLLSSREFWAAVLGGGFVLAGQQMANRAQRRRDQEAEREAVKAVLRAIKAELKTFNEKALIRLEEIFKARADSPIEALKPLGIAPLKQNYFIVFDSNAAALGKIHDSSNPELLGKIVTTYSAARNLLDSINYNNQRYQAWEPLTHVPGPSPEMHALTENLKKFAAGCCSACSSQRRASQIPTSAMIAAAGLFGGLIPASLD